MSVQYIFDVDGVLCDTGQHIDKDFSTFFQHWAQDKTYYLQVAIKKKQ
jgi:beta-phosphoglucomutase-like phosphatase (HAD superfamily)